MPLYFALPIASVIAVTALVAFIGRPRIHLRTYNKAYGGLRVVEVAFTFSRAGRPIRAGAKADPRSTEFVIYMTLKTGSSEGTRGAG